MMLSAYDVQQQMWVGMFACLYALKTHIFYQKYKTVDTTDINVRSVLMCLDDFITSENRNMFVSV